MSDPKSTPLPPPTPSEGLNVPSTSSNPDGGRPNFFSGIKRSASKAMQPKEGQTGKNMLKAYGKTIVGMSPIFLMGEALAGRKVGSQFKKGTSEMISAAEELRTILSDSSKDVLVVVDEKLRAGKSETTKTADVLRSAGEDAIVVVTSSLLNSRAQFEAHAPSLKHTMLKNSKDVVIIVDKAIKNPIVITGVTKFARSKGIPRPEAILTIAALGVGKLIKVLDEAEGEARVELEKFEADLRAKALNADEEGDLVVVDAGEFEKTVPREDSKKADEIGHAAAPPPGYNAAASTSAAGAGTSTSEPAVPGAMPPSNKNKPKKEKGDGCIIT